MVGFVTSVIIRVGSVTSTCLRSRAGDIRNLSTPIFPLSSGTLPGQISTTSGSATAADQATINERNVTMVENVGFMAGFIEGLCFSAFGACPHESYPAIEKVAIDLRTLTSVGVQHANDKRQA